MNIRNITIEDVEEIIKIYEQVSGIEVYQSPKQILQYIKEAEKDGARKTDLEDGLKFGSRWGQSRLILKIDDKGDLNPSFFLNSQTHDKRARTATKKFKEGVSNYFDKR